jgi:hypothetical protein
MIIYCKTCINYFKMCTLNKILKFIVVFIFISCEKRYSCVCHSNITKSDTLIDNVKTTKLGSKGYKDTCIKNEAYNSNLTNCHLE